MKNMKFKYKAGVMLVLVAILVITGWGSIKKNTDVNSSATKKSESFQH